MEKKKCPHCGMPLNNGICALCGYKDGDQIQNNFSHIQNNNSHNEEKDQKYCKHCGQLIDSECIICPKCGKQVESLKSDDKNIIINNSASSSASAVSTSHVSIPRVKTCNKWVAFCLCLFLGFLGGHKFYEGKIGMAILYIFTLGLLGIGVIIDLISILTKPNPYYV
ncbi:TM2 domain [Blautia hydrogenotrophica]|jgi:RNA polymerase subunit RPABC4/transcription elongation factor Spt4|uniref:TM2 domain-containing protein n=1 Tax=Blautia hydrogenotrophica TaxID=53443 RepID=UPI0006C46C81|nr:TM2 domain-containing protein [Blautia hydrogenotrophica]CUM74734.1 TM2 domain [Blautia hydrogenotrophica]SCI31145.1 TM2 domain [uncultured Blautia sp.]